MEQQTSCAQNMVNWDAGQALGRLGGDEKLFHEIVEIFLAEAPKDITSLRRAIEARDAEGIETTAHRLKGELGYLGISGVSQKACELEGMGRRRNLQHTAEVFAAFETEIEAVLNSMRSVNGMNPKQQSNSETGATQ